MRYTEIEKQVSFQLDVIINRLKRNDLKQTMFKKDIFSSSYERGTKEKF